MKLSTAERSSFAIQPSWFESTSFCSWSASFSYIASLQFLNEQQLCCSFKIRIWHHPFTSILFNNV